MQLTRINGCFVARGSFAEKDIPKGAKFTFHWGDSRCFNGCPGCKAGLPAKTWCTFDPNKAIKLAQYADSDTRAALQIGQDTLQTALDDSRAVSPTDATFNPPVPAGLAYLPYQLAGIQYASSRQSTLIADEMGLGKTIQALGVVNADPAIKTVLVVCPASLRLNWKREAEKWLTRSFTYHIVESGEIPSDATFIICNFDRVTKVAKTLMNRTFDLLVVDEAHKVKNPRAQRTRTVLGVPSRKDSPRIDGLVDRAARKVFLTGTPVLNKPVELHPLLAALDPVNFGNFFKFAQRYCDARETRFGWQFDGATNLDELQIRLRSSIMIRRLKKDVLTDLPAKIRQIVELPVNGAAAAVNAEAPLAAEILDYIEALADEVELAAASGNREEYEAAVQRLEEAESVAFNRISKTRHDTAVAKVPACLDHLDNLLEDGVEKLVVFAHHLDVLDAIVAHFGSACVRVDGSVSKMDDRQAAVDRFQNDPTCTVFVGGIQAAGVGLTLTASSHVVFCELDWVPANVSQAEDRCHRIGQRNTVQVQHLVLDGSIDARIAKVLIRKQRIADAALDNPVNLPSLPAPVVHGSFTAVEVQPSYPEVDEPTRENVAGALRALAGVCDGAFKRDDMGFNACDSRKGKSLANTSLVRPLTNGEVFLGKQILRKYSRQLGTLHTAIFGE